MAPATDQMIDSQGAVPSSPNTLHTRPTRTAPEGGAPRTPGAAVAAGSDLGGRFADVASYWHHCTIALLGVPYL